MRRWSFVLLNIRVSEPLTLKLDASPRCAPRRTDCGSGPRYAADLTSIFLPTACAFFGIVTSSTPSFAVAATASVLHPSGSARERKMPP